MTRRSLQTDTQRYGSVRHRETTICKPRRGSENPSLPSVTSAPRPPDTGRRCCQGWPACMATAARADHMVCAQHSHCLSVWPRVLFSSDTLPSTTATTLLNPFHTHCPPPPLGDSAGRLRPHVRPLVSAPVPPPLTSGGRQVRCPLHSHRHGQRPGCALGPPLPQAPAWHRRSCLNIHPFSGDPFHLTSGSSLPGHRGPQGAQAQPRPRPQPAMKALGALFAGRGRRAWSRTQKTKSPSASVPRRSRAGGAQQAPGTQGRTGAVLAAREALLGSYVI